MFRQVGQLPVRRALATTYRYAAPPPSAKKGIKPKKIESLEPLTDDDVKNFDRFKGSLRGDIFRRFCISPN